MLGYPCPTQAPLPEPVTPPASDPWLAGEGALIQQDLRACLASSLHPEPPEARAVLWACPVPKAGLAQGALGSLWGASLGVGNAPFPEKLGLLPQARMRLWRSGKWANQAGPVFLVQGSQALPLCPEYIFPFRPES